MEHKIIERDEFTVVGLPVKVSLNDPGYQKKIKDSWFAFMPRLGEMKNRRGEEFYGVCDVSRGIEGDECSFENTAGVEVTSAEHIPEGMKAVRVPAAKYFVATHKGRVEKVGETWMAIEKEMKALNLEEDKSKKFFELYDDRFKEGGDDSEFDLYTPLK